MVDGFYRIAFTGNHGSGFGMIVLREGVVAGADAAGATYDGTYQVAESGTTLTLHLTMHAPAGIVPVQTGIPLPIPANLPITATLPVDLTASVPTLVETPLGKVNVAFCKIRDIV